MPESTSLTATAGLPATTTSLTADLRTLGVPEGGVLLVHCALRSLGNDKGANLHSLSMYLHTEYSHSTAVGRPLHPRPTPLR